MHLVGQLACSLESVFSSFIEVLPFLVNRVRLVDHLLVIFVQFLLRVLELLGFSLDDVVLLYDLVLLLVSVDVRIVDAQESEDVQGSLALAVLCLV